MHIMFTKNLFSKLINAACFAIILVYTTSANAQMMECNMYGCRKINRPAQHSARQYRNSANAYIPAAPNSTERFREESRINFLKEQQYYLEKEPQNDYGPVGRAERFRNKDNAAYLEAREEYLRNSAQGFDYSDPNAQSPQRAAERYMNESNVQADYQQNDQASDTSEEPETEDGLPVYNVKNLKCAKKNSIPFCETQDGKPLTGIVKTYYASGNLETKSSWKDGTPNGITKTYAENGNLTSEQSYANGESDGTWKYYDTDGRLKSVEEFKQGIKLSKTSDKDDKPLSAARDDKKQKMYNADDVTEVSGITITKKDRTPVTGIVKRYDGASILYKNGEDRARGYDIYYDEKGVAYAEEEIEENKMSGMFRRYWRGDTNGNLEGEVSYKDGKKDGTAKKYYENGNLAYEIEYKDGKKDGTDKEYYENGNLISEIEYKDGKKDGTAKEYYKNGNLESEIEYKDGKKNGMSKKYYENRKLKFEIEYKDDQRNGISKIYNTNGNLESEVEYKDDMQNGITKSYYESGTLQGEVNYKDGKKNGIAQEYYENGNLASEIEYKDNKRNGISKFYNTNGKLEVERQYIDDDRVDLFKEIKNPNMQYAGKCNLSAHINKLSQKIAGNPKAFYGNNAASHLSNNTDINEERVYELLQQNKQCAEDGKKLRWTFMCEKSERKTSRHTKSYFDQECLDRISIWKESTYIDCLRQAGNSGIYYLPMSQKCIEAYQNWEEQCRRNEEVEEEYDTCEGEKKLIIENGYNDIVLMVDSFKQPNFNDIPYKRVVEALLKKYGPASNSKQKITKNDEKFEVFYWVDGNWIIQVEVKVDNFTDTTKVHRLDTYYLNYHNCIAQSKYEQEAEQRRIAAENAEKERIRKAKEDKIKNFEL